MPTANFKKRKENKIKCDVECHKLRKWNLMLYTYLQNSCKKLY